MKQETFIEARKKFGKWLKGHRKKNGLTQREIAEVLKLKNPQFVSNFERGGCFPSLPHLKVLSKKLGVKEDLMLAMYTSTMRVAFGERMHGKARNHDA